MSFVARTLKFEYASDLGKPPPGYKQSIPVAGGILDATVYPMAFGKTKGIMRGLGLNVMYDQVLLINSQKRYADAMGVQQIANLKTTENRWAVGPVLRYPMGKVVLGGSLTYGKQQFTVAQVLPNDEPTDIPSVSYTMITPAAWVKYPVTPKITVNGELAFHAITNTGQIQSSGMTGYGAATVTAFELEGGADYMVKKNIFVRASIRYESIGIKFKGDPTSQSNMRDTDPDQDVTGAKDTYFGGAVTAGYVY
jgi:predicted porin